ncbi:hypothetical protein F0562_025611 [Nyssa sinensis]|uniref:Uncharacterized protein n=1 Tax=Nyssa sinensis TaxID=561372 RepID=A0A5J5B8A4_9ASTE|nr:hypothetical protein F0562_025611 [Nyssa sinensis]
MVYCISSRAFSHFCLERIKFWDIPNRFVVIPSKSCEGGVSPLWTKFWKETLEDFRAFPQGDAQEVAIDFIFKGDNSLRCLAPRKAKDWGGYSQPAYLGKVAQLAEFAATEAECLKSKPVPSAKAAGAQVPPKIILKTKRPQLPVKQKSIRIQEPSESEPPKAKNSRTDGVSQSKGKEPLYPPPPPSQVDPLASLSDQAKIDFLSALLSRVQSSKSNKGAPQVDVAEAYPRKRRLPSSTPKPPRKKAKAKRAEVPPKIVIPEAEGVLETVPSEPQAGVGDSIEGLADDIEEGNLPSSSPIAHPSDAPARASIFAHHG